MLKQEPVKSQKMIFKTIDQLMPEEHFLRQLDQTISFNFIYDIVSPLYSDIGRPSIDPVLIIKMMLIGYLYGINSERRLEKEMQVNIAYKWFVGLDLDENPPDHSTLSQLRRRKFKDSNIFEEIFAAIVKQCIEQGFIDGKLLLTDSTHVKAKVSNDRKEQVTVDIEPSEYFKRLNEEAHKNGLCNNHDLPTKQKTITKSTSDPDAGLLGRPGKPFGFHYLSHQTTDAKHGFIADVFVTAGNVHDGTVHAARIEHILDNFDLKTEAICADAAYDSAEIHKKMLDRNIQTYIPKRNTSQIKDGYFSIDDFRYDPENDQLICPNKEILKFAHYRKKNGFKRYQATKKQCDNCPLREKCIAGKGKFRTVMRAYHREAWEKQHQTDGSEAYFAASIASSCNGTFSIIL